MSLSVRGVDCLGDVICPDFGEAAGESRVFGDQFIPKGENIHLLSFVVEIAVLLFLAADPRVQSRFDIPGRENRRKAHCTVRRRDSGPT